MECPNCSRTVRDWDWLYCWHCDKEFNYCPNCEGSGSITIFIWNNELEHYDDDEKICAKCNGNGIIEIILDNS